ncbi:MAG: YkgJ family cysteine cluster protein [Rhodospirillales bacterium]|nr:MAG: YkgJ family cysteine cluster protein [Rhodospirillales bacterium]
MERRFACTICGKCCQGWLPLTIGDAVRHAHLFPLAVLWSTVRQGSKAFALTGQLGLQFNKKVALRLTPLAYIPTSMPCPALTDGNRCSIHESKPLRCRAMPFSADRETNDQADLLIPRPGWLCDISPSAAVVYRDGAILDRADFEAERQALAAQAPVLKAYGEFLLKSLPSLKIQIEKLAQRPGGGQMVLKISPLLRKIPSVDLLDFARRQAPVLKAFLDRLPEGEQFKEYRKNYADWAQEMESLQGGGA